MAVTTPQDVHPKTAAAGSDLQETARKHLWMHFSRMGGYDSEHEIPIIAKAEGNLSIERVKSSAWKISLKSYMDIVSKVTVVSPTDVKVTLKKPSNNWLFQMTTREEADGLLAIAKRTGAVVQTGHVERFNRAVRAALPFVESPRFIESNRLAPFNPRGSDVAVVLDLMIHDIDLVRTFVGGAVRSVSAVGVPVLTPFVDIANARLSFEAGAVANITASRVSRERLRKLRIFQQTGYLSLDLGAGTVECYRLRRDVDFGALVRDAQGAQALESFVERVVVDAAEGEPLRLELEAFRRTVVRDERGERRIARIAGFGVWLVRALGWTWRIRVTHDDDVQRLVAANVPMIYSLWHGHLLPLLYHHRDQGVVVLISEHGDGEIIARIATKLGYRTVRGSTSPTSV